MKSDNGLNVRYIVSVGFAVFVFGAGFYGIVLYEYNLDDLKTGALISLMTLAAQYVFGEAIGASVGRRVQQSFDQGSSAGATTPPSGPAPAEESTSGTPAP